MSDERGGFQLAMLWIVTIGFLLVIGLAAVIFIFAVKSSLHSQDAIEVDERNDEESLRS